jgi:hypothetical protein
MRPVLYLLAWLPLAPLAIGWAPLGLLTPRLRGIRNLARTLMDCCSWRTHRYRHR